jgi:hypothetical protein
MSDAYGSQTVAIESLFERARGTESPPELLIDPEGTLWRDDGTEMRCVIDDGTGGLVWGTEIRPRQDIEQAYGPLRRLPWPPTTDTATTATVADEAVARRLEYKAEQALMAQPEEEWTDDEKHDFTMCRRACASAFTEAARIVRGES